MSRGAWIVAGVVLAVALGFGIRQAELALTPPPEPRPSWPEAGDLDLPPFFLVTPTEVRLDGDVLAATRDFASGRWLTALTKRLLSLQREWRQTHPDEEFAGEIKLCVTPRIDVGSLKRLLRACKAGGYTFIGLGKPRGALPGEVRARLDPHSCTRTMVSTSTPPDQSKDATWFPLKATLANTETVLQAGGSRRVLPKQDNRLLHKELTGVKAMAPNKDDLVIGAEDNVLVGDLLEALQVCKRSFSQITLDLQSGPTTD